MYEWQTTGAQLQRPSLLVLKDELGMVHQGLSALR
jgi:hypothetical protein